MISDESFEAFHLCAVKAHLKLACTSEGQQEFAAWQQRKADEYKRQCCRHLRAQNSEAQFLQGTPFVQLPPDPSWQVAFDCEAHTDTLLSYLHAVERTPPLTQGVPSAYMPMRFVPSEKITKLDRLMLAFDALCLGGATGPQAGVDQTAHKQVAITHGKIIHGADMSCVRVSLAGPMKTAREAVAQIEAQQTAPPPLVLNRHCPACEFQDRCRQAAADRDDLSLLSGMTAQERQQYHGKGMFTVTRLSHTFRPRRRPRRLAARPEPYHHALRALALREAKIHVAGTPQWKLNGTAVFLDVEGCPDRDFYYLVGVRIASGESHTQHSFWADGPSDEGTMWAAFLTLLGELDTPQLIYYGSYETRFLKRMKERYGKRTQDEAPITWTVDQLIAGAINVLAVTYAQIYFPTYSNGLKDVAGFLGQEWSEPQASGLHSLAWRDDWEDTHDEALKRRLVTYNAEDCAALERVASVVARICLQVDQGAAIGGQADLRQEDFTHTGEMKRDHISWFKKGFVLPDLNVVNKAAYWDHQRESIHPRPMARPRARDKAAVQKGAASARRKPDFRGKSLPINAVVECAPPVSCTKCGGSALPASARLSKVLYDLKFSSSGVKRWVVEYHFGKHLCSGCKAALYSGDKTWSRSPYGLGLLAYIVYQIVDLKLHCSSVSQHLNDVLGFNLSACNVKRQKARATELYTPTYEAIQRKIVGGKLIHADETRVNLKGIHGYVWILTSADEVIYFYHGTREGGVIQELLKDFRGVLVSDFYAVYDSINCPQQKCLIHLMRDLNDDLLHEPFNEEMKWLVQQFADVLKPAVETVDRFGLKARHLRKHKRAVERFYVALGRRELRTEIAVKARQRFQKNRDKLFTFLDFDGVPWHNNNAEHAVKAFAALRDVIGSSSTETGLSEYLTLLSICQTCKYQGLSFLDFLRSGVTDVDEFSRRKRPRRSNL